MTCRGSGNGRSRRGGRSSVRRSSRRSTKRRSRASSCRPPPCRCHLFALFALPPADKMCHRTVLSPGLVVHAARILWEHPALRGGLQERKFACCATNLTSPCTVRSALIFGCWRAGRRQRGAGLELCAAGADGGGAGIQRHSRPPVRPCCQLPRPNSVAARPAGT